MKLTKKQQEGLDLAIARYKRHEKYTVISGFAGSGKSTLVSFIVSALKNEGIEESDVCYCAFTGKAAQVLLKKGNKNVSTLHRLLYESYPKSDGTFGRRVKKAIDYRIIVVDECSMAPMEIIETLFKFPVYVLALGDPFQLPTINPEDDNHLLDKPHVFLDEIMRQAQESEIIRVSMAIREQKPLSLFNGHDVKIMKKTDLNTGMLTWADQILCATNKTRVNINNVMRQLLGRSDEPEDGDKVICLRNEWDYIADNEDPLVNGTVGYLKDCYSSFIPYPARKYGGDGKFDTLCGDFVSDSGALFENLQMDKKMILTGEKCCTKQVEYKIRKANSKSLYPIDIPLEFTYGYAITCHKSQGSQWDKVLTVEENFPFNKTEHARWLYTACTRAAQKLVLIQQ